MVCKYIKFKNKGSAIDWSLRAAKEQREECGWFLNLPHSLLKCFNQLIFLLLLFHPVHAGDDKLGDHPALGAGPGGTRQNRDALLPPQAGTLHKAATSSEDPPRERGCLSPQAADTSSHVSTALCSALVGSSSWDNPIQGTQGLWLFLDLSKSNGGLLSVQKQTVICECSRKPKTQSKVSQPFEIQ